MIFRRDSVSTVIGKKGAIFCIIAGICEIEKKTPPPKNIKKTIPTAIPNETSPFGDKIEISSPKER